MKITTSQLRRMIKMERRRLVREATSDELDSAPTSQKVKAVENMLVKAIDFAEQKLGVSYAEELEDAIDPILKMWRSESRGFEAG